MDPQGGCPCQWRSVRDQPANPGAGNAIGNTAVSAPAEKADLDGCGRDPHRPCPPDPEGIDPHTGQDRGAQGPAARREYGRDDERAGIDPASPTAERIPSHPSPAQPYPAPLPAPPS